MTIEKCQKHAWITSKTPSQGLEEGRVDSAHRQVSEIRIQILPARITVTDEDGKREEVVSVVSSPPLRRPHQITLAEKENSIEALTKRFKFREPLASPSVTRRASIGSPVHSRVTCK
jgi:hypothetical protein